LQVILAPGHEAIGVLRDLLAVLDSNPIALQYLRVAADQRLPKLERHAREILRNGKIEQPRPSRPFEWCEVCRCDHAFPV
jgi:hypothetical protein